ncbi:MAG: sigma-70 family RNA polymerase sigma factor [Gemmataceae bacterium]
MPRPPDDTDELIEGAGRGDAAALSQLLVRHRPRLRQMVSVRMDHRLAARVDPSDVIQDTLIEAARRFADYLRDRPLPFYPWLRQMALDRLTDLHRRHVQAGRRSVTREEMSLPLLPDESGLALVARLFAGGGAPGLRLEREEARERVRQALRRLPERDREVLALRHLEQMPSRQIGAVLGLSEGAVNARHVRALGRLSKLLAHDPPPGGDA